MAFGSFDLILSSRCIRVRIYFATLLHGFLVSAFRFNTMPGERNSNIPPLITTNMILALPPMLPLLQPPFSDLLSPTSPGNAYDARSLTISDFPPSMPSGTHFHNLEPKLLGWRAPINCEMLEQHQRALYNTNYKLAGIYTVSN